MNLNEQDEEDEIMRKELEGVEVEDSIEMSNNKVAESHNRASNGNTTTDSSNLQNDQKASKMRKDVG